MVVQYLQDDLALKRPGSLASQFFQRNGAVQVDVGGDKVVLSGLQVAADNFFAAENDIPLDQVLEFADVSWPVVLLQYFHQFRRKRPRFAVVLAVVILKEIVHQAADIAAPLT